MNRSLVFTSPQNNINRLAFVTLNGSYKSSDSLSIQSNLYYRDYHQSVVNGNTTDYTACTVAPYRGDLCQADGATPLTNSAGGLLPDISQGGTVYIGENDFESIHSVGVGGSIQATETAALFGHENHLTVGGSIDSATTNFGSSAEVGTINSALVVGYSGLFVDTPENTPWTATPVSLVATNRYYGVFGTDTLNLTKSLAVTASARYNLALINLMDQRGDALTGQSRYSRLNPAIGFTEKLTHEVTAFVGYSEGSRAPTPVRSSAHIRRRHAFSRRACRAILRPCAKWCPTRGRRVSAATFRLLSSARVKSPGTRTCFERTSTTTSMVSPRHSAPDISRTSAPRDARAPSWV